MLQKNFNN